MPGLDHDSNFFRVTELASFPPQEQWDDWAEYDPAQWPKKVEKRYRLVPTTCFNCEAACGLVAYVDKETHEIRKLEGNPFHPGSRGRNCAKGPATLNQIEDPQRILYPLKRVGPRGSGRFERTTWDEVLDTIAAKIRTALLESRHNEIMYHVGRPGHDGYMDRVLRSWGVDGHNSHTNVCSSSARVGYALWSGADRPSPDHANAKFILLLSSHLETGHYFNPHAQRIIEGKSRGAKICAIDIRLSNTASMSDYWLAPHPGTEAMLLLSFAHVILNENLFDRRFVEDWTNWREYLREYCPGKRSFEDFIRDLNERYAHASPRAAAEECGVSEEKIVEIAREIGRAGSALATHVWRNAAAGNLGGWQVSRCLQFICVLMGAVGAKGGTNLNTQDKFIPAPFLQPPPQRVWNELLYPREYPLCYHEMSILLPHFLMEGRGKLAAYFTRVYNPVWTNPDGMMWEKVLRDESKVELHAALTPMWSETAQYADYVLPMGLGAERHDLMSQETHAAKWISFRQPVRRVAREADGETFEHTHEVNPGEVWEEDEFWIALSWRIDPDGALGIRKYYESPDRPGQRITVHEYYRWIFENTVPGLPSEAAKHNLSPLEYMRKFGAFLVEEGTWEAHAKALSAKELDGAQFDRDEMVVKKDGKTIGGLLPSPSERGAGGEGAKEVAPIAKSPSPCPLSPGRAFGPEGEGSERACVGFKTPSKRLEIFSKTMQDWGWPEYALPAYIESHVHRKFMDRSNNEYVLVPTFRLPTLIHTRSANAKWLYELSNTNPVWIHPEDASRIGIEIGELVRITTRIGYYVNKVWVTEGVRPGVVACSHHLGRWRLFDDVGTDKWASAKVVKEEVAPGQVRFRRIQNVGPFKSGDPDSSRIWWTDGGVHQNLTFCVQPDPVSGMQCWHQKVTVRRASEGDHYADVFVDLNKSMEAYREWLALTRPAPAHGPGNLRRPLWFARAVRPADEAYVL